MTSILQAEPIGKVVGVDTPKHVHTAVAVDAVGGARGTISIPAHRGGYEHSPSGQPRSFSSSASA